MVSIANWGCSVVCALAPAAQQSTGAEREGEYLEIYDVRDLALPSGLRARADLGSAAVATDDSSLERKIQALLDRKVEELAERHRAATLALATRVDDAVRSDVVAWRLLDAFFRSTIGASDAKFDSNVVESGALVVRARASAHGRIRETLAALRRSEPDAVVVTLEAFELDAAQRRRLVELENPAAAGDPFAVAQIQHVEPATIDRLGAERIALPQIVALQLEPFELRVGTERSYVEKFELVAIEGMGRIADPVVKTVFEGVTVRGRIVAPSGLDDGEAAFALRLEVEQAVLKRPVESVKTDAGEIQLPEVKHATIATTVAGDARRAFLVGGVPKPSFDSSEDDRRLYVLVTVGGSLPREGAREPQEGARAGK